MVLKHAHSANCPIVSRDGYKSEPALAILVVVVKRRLLAIQGVLGRTNNFRSDVVVIVGVCFRTRRFLPTETPPQEHRP